MSEYVKHTLLLKVFFFFVNRLLTQSEVKWSRSVVSISLWPHGLYSPWNSPDLNTGVGSRSLLQGSSQPRDRTQVSHIASRFFTAEPQGKPKNTGVGSLSLLQQTFPTQELNQGLLQADPLQTELSGKTTMLLLETNHTSIKKTHKTKGLSLLIAKNRLIPGLPCWSSG